MSFIISLIPRFIKIFIFLFIAWLCYVRFKPVLAFWLWLRDFFKKDRKSYPVYGFWLFCGLGGSGKTISMVEYLNRMKKRYPKVKIYTNFNCEISDGIVDDWRDIVNLENYELIEVDENRYFELDDYNRFYDRNNDKFYEKKHQGIIFGFDEIHLTFASQNWKSCPENMLEYISQQRKFRKHIIASSQVFTRIDKKLREQTNFVIECKSLFGGRWILNRYFHTAEYIANGEKMDKGKNKRKRAKRYSFIAYDKIRNLYDTYQVMKNITVGKSDNEVLADEIIKRVAETLK